MVYQNVAKELYKFPQKQAEISSECYSTVFLKIIRTYISGSIDTSKYEDLCRHFLGQQAYLLFTIEGVLNSVITLLFIKPKILDCENITAACSG